MNHITVALEAMNNDLSRIRIHVTGMAPISKGGRTRYQRLRFAAGTIPTKDWDTRMKRPSAAYSRRDGGMLHRSIDLTYLNVQRAYLEAPRKTAEAIRDRYNELLGIKRIEERGSTLLYDVVEGWVAKRAMADHTIHTYIGFNRKVDEYQRRSKVCIDLATVEQSVLVEFLNWVQGTKGLAHNSMASVQKLLNKALHEVRASGVNTCPKLREFGYKTPKKDVLDWLDLAKVISFQPRSAKEARAQTMLVAMALSSVRISDLWKHLGSIRSRSGCLCSDFVVSKNAGRHAVSVSPIVFEPVRVLLARNGQPHRISEIHVRRSIKDLVQAVGIEKHIEVHSLRRSFVSLFLSLGVVPDHLLARVFTGHRMAGEKSVFHAYNHASMVTAQRTVIQMLRLVDRKQTAGIELLSPAVCDF